MMSINNTSWVFISEMSTFSEKMELEHFFPDIP